jgi:hypothetical protein
MNVSYTSRRLAEKRNAIAEFVVGSVVVALLLASAVWAFRVQLTMLAV